MKIGILTFHRACNYGGVIQCYALSNFLMKKGYDVEVVDYRCTNMERHYKLFNAKTVKQVALSLYLLPFRWKRLNNFLRFRKRHLTISKEIYQEPNDFNAQYDICIVGSDQVWCPRIIGGIDPVYFGMFSDKIRKIAYAASDEKHIYTREQVEVIKKALNMFESISVREESFAKALQGYTNKQICTVCDPSLLLLADDYSELIEEPEEKNYILYYQQENHPMTKNVIVDVARQINANLIVVVTGKKEKYDYPYKYYDTSNLSVNKWLGLFKHAKCVFTSSFHGTAFSVIFRKDFYFVANGGPERAFNLLKRIGGLERFKKSTDMIKFSHVDYSIIEPLLNEYRKESESFLINSIENYV